MTLTFFLTIIRIFSNSFLNVEQKRLSQRVSSLETNFKTYFILCMFLLPVLLLFYLKSLSAQVLLLALIGGIFGAAGNACLIKALKLGELSILGPVNSYKAIFALIFGVLFLREIPGINTLSGMALIILGSYFVFETSNEGFGGKFFRRKDIQLRMLALILTALEAVFIKKIIILTDAVFSFILWALSGCFFAFVFLKLNKPKTPKAPSDKICNKTLNKYKNLPLRCFLSPAFLVLIMQMSTNLIFEKIPVSAALSLFQLSNILNVFLGCKLFNEKHLLKKLAGSAIMIIGSAIIILNG